MYAYMATIYHTVTPEHPMFNTNADKLRAYNAESDRLCALADAAMLRCEAHPVPAPELGSRLVPKGCTCYTQDPDWRAFMDLRSPVCNICGGWDKCKPGCEALDRR